MFLSIIIPVYNVEAYIEECLDGFLPLEQSDYEYEILLINDGSPDNSRELIIPYLDRFKNIKLIDKTNGGLSSARNEGIKNAVGDYLLFVDSDDYIFVDKLLDLMRILSEKQVDILRGEYIRSNGALSLYKDLRADYANKEISINEFYTYILLGENYSCLSLYRRQFILNNELYFKDKLYFEDTEFILNILGVSATAFYVNIPFYYYRINPNSITQVVTLKHVDDVLYIMDKLCNIINSTKRIEKDYQLALRRNLTGLFLMVYVWSIKKKDLESNINEIKGKLKYYNSYLVKPINPKTKVKFLWYKTLKYRFFALQRSII